MKDFIQNNNNFAIAYYRYSSHNQNDASIEQQQDMAREYAKAHDLTIIKEYADRAISGTDGTRPEFQLMLSEVAKLKPSTLILWKTDRLSRDRYDLINAKKKIRDAGCCIECIAEAIPTNSNEGVLMESIFEGMSEYYSRQLRQNVMRGLHYNAERALWNGGGRGKLGYRKGSDKKFEIDPDTSPIVERIFSMYHNGYSTRDIAKSLNAQGLKTSRGGQFAATSITKILKNRIYIGEYHYGDVTIPKGIPAIISDELFAEVQAKLAENSTSTAKKAIAERGESPRYWLTSKLRCGICGGTVHGITSKANNGNARYFMYGCRIKRDKHTCDLQNIHKELLEDVVVKTLDEFLSDSENLASLAVDVANYSRERQKDDAFLESLKSRLKETETGLKNLLKAVEAGAAFSDTMRERMQELEEQKKDLQEAIELESVKHDLAGDNDSIQRYFEFYRDADLRDDNVRNTLFEYFVDKIYLYNDCVVISCKYDDRDRITDLQALREATRSKRKNVSLAPNGCTKGSHRFTM